ncbi:kinesin-like protein KIF12 isoform X2 [Leptopilina heterotoma]|uniref:kinesin-like protein KIF12 isoform X2 n=1 Tax=Leptopilina heterotoma TaxID=63436 RepID=UPI001CAA1C7B|nr:kinesin-like protein KIF12 isoform X2 [Leptopilina heterotoma]
MVMLRNPSPLRGETPPKNSRKLEQKKGGRNSRGVSPSEKSSGSRGSSPGKSSLYSKGLRKSPSLGSRGSETGSIEKLNVGDRRAIASKHLLPDHNINVVIRVRPLSNKEIKARDDMAVQFPGGGQIYCDGFSHSTDKKAKLFSYNAVFEPAATQEDILLYSGIKKLIEMAVEGFSCTVFCYGQTGSGKTHTLTGPPGLFLKMNPYSEDHGLVFRSFVYLFKLLQERHECHFVLKASFLEIYNEKVIDLLNPGLRKPLAVRWSKKSRGFFVENLFTVECEELDDLLAVLEEGMRNRAVGSHNMNDHSSRSHTILTVHITSEQQMENGVFITRQGKINFVDLAGSEMTKKTHSEGKTLEEANNINKSLMVLGYCIASLSDGRKKGVHIPYRDSKLTKLLADSLAGNGVSLMIACISPARSNASETINTLRYASRAKKIRTKPIVVMDPREALILSLKREVDALQMENNSLRAALYLGNDSSSSNRNDSKAESRVPKTPPVDLDKLAELENSELSQLVRAYINENEALRRENAELYSTHEQVIRDQEIVCRENERLLKKLEDVNSVCCRSPIIPARPTYSSEMLNDANNDDLPDSTNIWTNPNAHSNSPNFSVSRDLLDANGISKYGSVMPQKVLKELDKRRIIGSVNNIAEAYKDKSHHRRHNSWDNGNESFASPDQIISPVNGSRSQKRATLRRTSTVPEAIKGNASKINDIMGGPVFSNVQSLNGTPDSILSESLLEGGNMSAPDSAESETPTAPFPLLTSSSPFPTTTRTTTNYHNSYDNYRDVKLLSRTNSRSRINENNSNSSKDTNIQRVFGSLVTPDEQFHNQPI